LLASVAAGNAALSAQDPTNQSLWETNARIARLQALGALSEGDAAAAGAAAQRARTLLHKVLADKDAPSRLALGLGEVEETLGAAYWAAGDRDRAVALWRAALARLGPELDDDLQMLALRQLLAIDLGQDAVAARLATRLAAAGFHDPRFDPEAARSRITGTKSFPRVVDSSPPPAPPAPVR
jgi:tetratricopeptide (TPR) repeat protein